MNAWTDEFAKVLLNPWAVVGFLGQGLFLIRWIVQWVASERRRESYVPLVFWYISLAGGLLVLIYAVVRHDPVFILSQLVGIGNYSRNIVLVRKKHVNG
jgi:lipid-A-disaccharide synthase-like uncharacterized protein